MSGWLVGVAVGLAVLAVLVGLYLIARNDSPGERLTTDGPPVSYFHDDARAVSCWLYGGSGNYGKAISCLPDSEVSR